MKPTSFDFYPAKSFFTDAGDVAFHLVSSQDLPVEGYAQLTVYHLGSPIHSRFFPLPAETDRFELPVCLDSHQTAPGSGFLAACDVFVPGISRRRLQTAFDIAQAWYEQPRYGFLCDFPIDHENAQAAIEELLKFHINGLQFYDWHYRHDQLMPDQSVYKDVLGRQLSLDVIKQFIGHAHQRGMACLPYLAIYGASMVYWNAHQDQGLYDPAGKALLFHDFLGLMNPSSNSPWANHLLTECRKTLEQMPFDGLHIDQYGDPKIAYDSSSRPVDLPAAFVDFINRAKENHPEKTVVFNAVGNWPIEALCKSRQDFMYIEIWPPAIRYQDLVDIIQNAQHQSGNKPVVLALYVPARRIANIHLSSAVILASGATRIELGEQARYLSDPYFPKHQPISSSLYKRLRKLYDFAVAYREWLKPTGSTFSEGQVEIPQGVMCLSNILGNRTIMHLINFTQLAERRWDKPHATPRTLNQVKIRLSLKKKPGRILYASPDESSIHLLPVPFEWSGGALSMVLPRLKYWSMISIETE